MQHVERFNLKMENQSAKLDELAFDNAMLKVLMVEFLRDSKFPYSMASNQKFQSIIRYLRPDVTMPTYADLLKMNIDEFNQFTQWEKRAKMGNNDFNNERVAMAQAYMRPRVTHVSPSPKTFQEVHERQHAIYYQNHPSTESPIQNNHDSSKPDDYFIKEEPMSDYVEKKPQNSEIQSSTSFSSETSPEISSNRTQPKWSPMYSTDMEQANEPEEDVKPDINALKMLLQTPKNESSAKPNVIQEDALSTMSTNPEAIEQQQLSSKNSRKMKKPIKASDKYLVFEDMPGIVKWPCLVCHQRLESSKVRSVNNHDAYIMLFVCVMNNLFSIEKAKEIARMQRFKCCAVHLAELHGNALHFLGVVDPEIDVHTENEKIIDAYHVVKSIRDSRYLQKLVFEGSRKHIIPFCTNVKHFFEKYGRQTYLRR